MCRVGQWLFRRVFRFIFGLTMSQLFVFAKFEMKMHFQPSLPSVFPLRQIYKWNVFWQNIVWHRLNFPNPLIFSLGRIVVNYFLMSFVCHKFQSHCLLQGGDQNFYNFPKLILRLPTFSQSNIPFSWQQYLFLDIRWQ